MKSSSQQPTSSDEHLGDSPKPPDTTTSFEPPLIKEQSNHIDLEQTDDSPSDHLDSLSKNIVNTTDDLKSIGVNSEASLDLLKPETNASKNGTDLLKSADNPSAVFPPTSTPDVSTNCVERQRRLSRHPVKWSIDDVKKYLKEKEPALIPHLNLMDKHVSIATVINYYIYQGIIQAKLDTAHRYLFS